MSYLLVHKSRVRANFDVSDFLIHVFFLGYQCSCSRSQFGMFASFRSIAMCGITYPTKSSKGGGLAWTQLHFISIGGDGYQTLFGSWVLKQKGFLTER